MCASVILPWSRFGDLGPRLAGVWIPRSGPRQLVFTDVAHEVQENPALFQAEPKMIARLQLGLESASRSLVLQTHGAPVGLASAPMELGAVLDPNLQKELYRRGPGSRPLSHSEEPIIDFEQVGVKKHTQECKTGQPLPKTAWRFPKQLNVESP